MNTRVTCRLTRPLALALAVSMSLTPVVFVPVATAQSYGSTQEQSAFTQQELDQMLAPIALYPDSLLSQILMASTYPLEVVRAARWSRANTHLKGEQAVRAVESQDWDPSVKSLVAFPQILEMMDQKLDWTERLGDAFLAQQPQVMDTVQQLRHRAYTAGNLRSNDQIRVTPQERVIVVEPAQPQIVYVPYYNPVAVYGPWWWPDYPPVYWAPWPGYYARPGLSVNLFWGSGISLSHGFFFGGFDWHRRQARVVNVHNYYYSRGVIVNRDTNVARVRTVNVGPGEWRHDPDHRRGVPYRAASLRQQFGRTEGSPEGRREIRGRDSTTIINNQEDRRDVRGPAARVENNTDTRRDTRERSDNRPDARGPSSRADTSTIVRPDGRERDGNRPDLRDARGPGFRNEANGRPDVRGQENNGRPNAPDARISAPRVDNNTDRRPIVRERNDNRSDVRDAPSVVVRSEANVIARPDVPKQAENQPDLRAIPASRAELRVEARPEVRVGLANRAEIRDSRPNVENRSAASVRAAGAPADVRSAVILSNPVPQAKIERNISEPRRVEAAAGPRSSGDAPGRGSPGSREVSKKEEQKK